MGEMDKRMLFGKEIPDNYVVSNAVEIEDLVVALARTNKKLDWYKALKQKRIKDIEEETQAYEAKATWLRDLILSSMQEHSPSEKTLNFPGIAKVSRRNVKGSWDISDEEAMLACLADQGMKDEVVRIKEVVDKKKAKDVLEQLHKMRITVPGVTRSEDSEGISVSFSEGDAVNEKVQKISQAVSNDDMDSLDTLDL